MDGLMEKDVQTRNNNRDRKLPLFLEKNETDTEKRFIQKEIERAERHAHSD